MHTDLVVENSQGISDIEKSSRVTEGLSLAILSLITLSPFFIYIRNFKQLFWFGDELHLLLEIKQQGFFPWLFTNFAENFVPVFKLLWGGVAILTNGSYLGLLLIVWFTHALNVFLFGLVLRNIGFSIFATTFSMLTFGLCWSNIETLGWGVQWSAMLALTFFLAAFLVLQNKLLKTEAPTCSAIATYLLLVACSNFSFFRGVIFSGILAAYTVVLYTSKIGWKRSLFISSIALLPAGVTALIIFLHSPGNHHSIIQQDLATWTKMFLWMAHHFFLNPFYHILNLSSDNLYRYFALGALKVLVLAIGCFALPANSRWKAVIILLGIDTLNTALLGIGRYHEGFASALSWRYQYASFICFSPFLGIAIQQVLTSRYRRMLQGIFLLSWVTFITLPWKTVLVDWSKSRGTEGRRFLIENDAAISSWWGVPGFLSTEQVREVVKDFTLH